jgi:NAD(P)-dependent dehydrogenase (short-subunit alcohol dehydrogenase family)
MTEKKTAIITGGGSGVGKAAATALAGAGWNLVLTGRRLDPLKETAAALSLGDDRCLAKTCDVSVEADVDALFDAAAQTFGHIDLLFNNAGTFGKAGLIDELDVAVWNDVVAANLTGAFLCARAAFRHMRRQQPQGGRIINNGSISAYAPRPGSIAYTSTKHAITGLTKTLALDGRPFDIACGQIDIGNALTDMAAAMTKGVPQANGTIAVEPVMDVSHVGDAILHMASLPLGANVMFMTIMATNMPFAGRG